MSDSAILLYVIIGQVWAVFVFEKQREAFPNASTLHNAAAFYFNMLLWPICAPLGIYRLKRGG